MGVQLLTLHQPARLVAQTPVFQRLQNVVRLEDRAGRVLIAAQMFAQQPRGDRAHACCLVLIPRIDRKVAFAVEAKGAVVEIGRPDAQHPAVHDQHLGMHHDLRRVVVIDIATAVLRAGDRMHQHHPVAQPGVFEVLHGTVASRIHAQLLHHARQRLRHDGNQHQVRHVLHPVRECFDQHVCGEILVLQVDVALGLGNHVEMQELDLAPLLHMPERGAGAGDPDLEILEIRFQALGPAVIGGVLARSHGGAFADCVLPARVHKLCHGMGRVAAHHHLHVMPGRIALALRHRAPVVIRRVRAFVPPPGGEVDAAHKGNLVINDDDLLMVARAWRQMPVQLGRDAGMPAPVELQRRQPFPLQCIDEREIPL